MSKSKKGKNKISKLVEKSDSENEENIHELSFYMNDRVKLMKEVLKIIKPKKIKSMAPDCIKGLDIKEINSMLLEELLGISNKRLKYIFSGQNLDEDSSSTDPEEEKQPIDIISLDDVSDDDFIIDVDSDPKSRKQKHPKVKQEPKTKRTKIKQEKVKKEGPLQEESLMSVLELLELQARARAIRSQLLLEANKKTSQDAEVKADDDSDDAVIVEVPTKPDEIVINSSESETEQNKSKTNSGSEPKSRKKITLIRDRFDKSTESSTPTTETVQIAPADGNGEEATPSTEDAIPSFKEPTANLQQSHHDDDEIVLIVDQEEMDGMIGESS